MVSECFLGIRFNCIGIVVIYVKQGLGKNKNRVEFERVDFEVPLKPPLGDVQQAFGIQKWA